MIAIIIYQLVLLVICGIVYNLQHLFSLPDWYLSGLLFVKSGVLGAIGGLLYCMRGIYLNKCVRKTWSEEWYVWYYLRPIISFISGFISAIILKAGLLLLEASSDPNTIPYGFLALAFIAGYNVDNFMKKIESIAHTAWGIEKSREGTKDTPKDNKNA